MSASLGTTRLTLVPATSALLEAELESVAALGAALGAAVPDDWPPGEYDADAIRFFIARLAEGGEAAAGWYSWYALTRTADDGPATLVGSGGYLGPPGPSGDVEIGYSVSAEWRGRGFATEIVRALADDALRRGAKRVVIRMRADNAASIGVARAAGFRRAGVDEAELLVWERP